jgi:hypothetical protein
MTFSFEGSFTVAYRQALMRKEVGIMAEFSLERVLVEGCEVLVTYCTCRGRDPCCRRRGRFVPATSHADGAWSHLGT